MNTKLAQIKKFRLFILKEINGLTSEQLNAIPEGFNNNIIWNLAHLVAAQQALCYKRAGLDIVTDDRYFTPFLPATMPGDFIDSEEIGAIKELFISTIDTLQADLEKELFGNYTKSERVEQVYGIGLLTIDDAIDFVLYHDGYHCGYITALKRLV